MKPEDAAANLLSRGYVEITGHGRLHVGQRVSHIGERYSEALRSGTATIERMFKSPRIIHGRKDVELIVKRDKPTGLGGTHGYWADYHTVITEPVS